MRTWIGSVAAGLVALASGCASTSAKPAFDEVARTVTAHTGHSVRWNQGGEEDRQVERAIDELLKRELTADAAVQVALLGNPDLQAEFDELAISQADLVQAGLLRNPVFSIGRTAWEGEHLAPNLFASLEMDFLDLLTMPFRKRVAATELEATKLEVGYRVLELAAEVREAYYTAQAAEQMLALRRLVEDAATASGELAKHQYTAGNMSDLALNAELALAAQATLDRERAAGDAAVARESLNKRMGVWGARTAWKLADKLPELPKEEPTLDRLESVAISQRLDVAAARRSIQAMDYGLSLAKGTRWTGTLNVSVEAGRLRHNKRLSFGPSVALEIPLFDQRQAQIAKLEAYKRQAENRLRSLAIDVRSDVRSSRARVTTARAVVAQYGKVLVPLRENVVRFSQQQYDAMLLGVYQLLQAKQTEVDTYREYIEALRDYWIARSELEHVIGGRLDAKGTQAPVAESPVTSQVKEGRL
jgi:cobalt-zinc-cadmium efflux system outer membrane protein